MIPLTSELLHARTAELFNRCIAAGGPVEDIIFEVIRCDGCEQTHNILRDGFPVGWRTTGDSERGFYDLCPSCFARYCVSATGFECPQ